MSIRTVRHASWAEFRRDLFPELFAPDAVFRRGVYLFRGQGNADRRLVTSFDRRFERFALPERMRLWEELVEQWRTACREGGVAADVVDDDSALLALGQHHGLPTRMLDWSVSPYVAAFFAFEEHLLGAAPADAVAVWALHLDSPAWSGAGVEIVRPPAGGNDRLGRQAGAFTLSRAAIGSLEDHVLKLDGGTTALTRFVLPAIAAEAALADLDAMGITAHDLFPDLGGLTGQALVRTMLARRPADA